MSKTNVPIWFMRQAGRYLPEYIEISKKMSFFQMCSDPEIASEITLQPIKRFKSIDAAIIFSDILIVPKALGVKIDILKDIGPVIESISFVEDLKFDKFEELIQSTLDAIHVTRRNLPKGKTLIGFAGAPWTIAAYIIEGKWNKVFCRTKKFFYQKRAEFERIIDIITDATITYLNKQIEHGAEIVQIFESFAGVLPAAEFEKWIIEPTKKIVQNVKAKVIGFPLGAGTNYVKYVKKTNVDVIGVDYTLDIEWVAENLQNITTIQGNLDPFLLAYNKEMAIAQTKKIVECFGFKDKKFIFNLGHGMFKETPLENVYAVLEEVEKFRSAAKKPIIV